MLFVELNANMHANKCNNTDGRHDSAMYSAMEKKTSVL